MEHHLRFVWGIVLISSLFLASCGKDKSAASDQDLDLDRESGSIEDSEQDYYDESNVGQTAGTDPSMNELSNALGGIQGENAQEQQALTSTNGSLSQLAQGFEALVPGASQAQVNAGIQALHEAYRQAEEAAKMLELTRFIFLARILRELASKDQVFRFVNKKKERNLFTSSYRDAYGVGNLSGFDFKGVVARVYRYPRHACKGALYSCLVPVKAKAPESYFTSKDESCGGNSAVKKGRLGYVCEKTQEYASTALVQLKRRTGTGNKVGMDYLLTIDKSVIDKAKKNKNKPRNWQFHSELGFAPN